jgi:hypothetical protein
MDRIALLFLGACLITLGLTMWGSRRGYFLFVVGVKSVLTLSLIAAGVAWYVSSAHAGEYCSATVVRSIPYYHVGDSVPSITQYVKDKTTGQDTYCSHGGGCVPADAVRLKDCSVGGLYAPGLNTGSEIIYSVNPNPTAKTTDQTQKHVPCGLYASDAAAVRKLIPANHVTYCFGRAMSRDEAIRHANGLLPTPLSELFNPNTQQAMIDRIPTCKAMPTVSEGKIVATPDPCIYEGGTGAHFFSASKGYSVNCGPYDCEAMARFYLQHKTAPPNPIDRQQ